MKIKTYALLIFSHLTIAIVGFAIGIYSLPILTAPKPPTNNELKQLTDDRVFTTEFKRELEGSDFLHWGEGQVSLGKEFITFDGKLSPGPDFKLYLSPEFIETEEEFNRLKSSMRVIGDVNTFNNFIVKVPKDVELTNFNTVVVWCESFGEFITSSKYR